MQEKKETKAAMSAAEEKVTAETAATKEVKGTEAKKPGRKPGAKKPGRKPGAAKKEKAEMELKLVVQTNNRPDIDTAAVQEKIKAKFVAEGHRAGAIKKFEVYIQPENNKAYYVINDGKFTGDVDLF
ncbi:MAG: DUF6465 family protein [Muribaculaceae bacterium]|nr:DUF6465 family protein [Roseburia sp.]MCM1430175.1 DUF6465 family protein [Muribaculaceae bacterium]MCM1493105.1 DUF6465 family protein [Muribaculaceae bacterium]